MERTNPLSMPQAADIPPSGISTVRDAKTIFMVIYYISLQTIKLLGNTCGGPVRGGKNDVTKPFGCG